MNMSILVQVLAISRELHQHERWTHQQLEAYQAKSLQLLRAYAYAHSPFYQQFHQGLTDRPLEELPVLTKALVMEHFDELVTDRVIHREEVEQHVGTLRGDERFLGRYWVMATSGSTGRPGLFLFDRSEWAMVLAAGTRPAAWAGSMEGSLLQNLTHPRKAAAVASTTPWHQSARGSATLRSRFTPILQLAASDPVESLVARLNAWQPDTLSAYPSVARVLADEQLAGRLRIAPQRIFTTSELLTEETRRRIEEAWQTPPFNSYVATEAGGLAAECEQHRGLHLYEDLEILEIVDEHNRPVSPGVYGDKVLLTRLFGSTQPLIRYELSDQLRLAAAPCPCGRLFRLLDGIQGRSEDVLHLPAAAGGEVAINPLVFHQLLDVVPASGWQVVQEDDGLKVLLSGVREGFALEKLVGSLRQALVAQGAVVPPIEVRVVSAIPRGASGKAPLITSNRSRPSAPV